VSRVGCVTVRRFCCRTSK